MSDTINTINSALMSCGVLATAKNEFIGPTVTTYELALENRTKVSKVFSSQEDLCIALEKNVVITEKNNKIFLEVENSSRTFIGFNELTPHLIDSSDRKIPVLLGVDTLGNCVVQDLASMPHMIIAGSTGSGKSVTLNSIISGILLTKSESEVQFILIDPKMVELSRFSRFPHVNGGVITEVEDTIRVLSALCREMDKRYSSFAAKGVQSIDEFNSKGNSIPRIVVVFDELADFMLQNKKQIEPLIVRLVQKARAAGIHMILCTQRPSVSVITGLIKANVPARIALRCSQSVDSRIILDQNGAENLLGTGDMLFSFNGTVSRVQAPFISSQDIQNLLENYSQVA